MPKIHYIGREGMLNTLERFAEHVRKGEIEYFVIAAQNNSDSTFAWAGEGGSVPTQRTIGLLEVVKAELVRTELAAIEDACD